MAKEYEKRINLNNILEELQEEEYIEKMTGYTRFKKIIVALNSTIDEFKDENGEVSLFEEDKEFIKGLIIEVGEPFLKKMLNKKIMGKTLEDGYNEAIEFRNRMLKKIETIKSPERREVAFLTLEQLSRVQTRELVLENEKRIKEIGDFIVNTNLYKDEFNGLIMEINDALDKYYENLKKRFGDR